MSDFSYFSLFTAGLACFAPLAAAYTQPKGDSPVGNPISEPGLNSVVPAGENFTITWEPTTKGTVTLVLLKGPSANAIPQYAIVEKTPNDGVYTWDVSSSLEPTSDATGYGIQLIDDATGQYQYTTQFGISNPDYKKSEPSSSASDVWGHGKPTSAVGGWTTIPCPEETTVSMYSQTWVVTAPTTLTIPVTATRSAWGSGGSWATGSSKPHNVTMIAPTGGAPTTSAAPVYTSPTISASPTPSVIPANGAASMAVSFLGLAFAGVAALFVL